MHIAILGAGISGLATAWFLKQSFGSRLRLTLIEKSQRVGGWIETLQKEGFLFEQGPRSCRTKGAGKETLALIEALGLQDQILVPHPDARNRYLYNGQCLQRLPKHLWEIPLIPLTRGWLKALWRDWRMPKRQEKDESIRSFFSRRLGDAWVENLIDPFVSGIYAGDCSRLSLKSCFPLFDQWEQQQGSLLRGTWHHRSPSRDRSPFIQKMSRSSLFSFREGMEVLPRTLAHELKDCLSVGQGVNQLHFDAQGVDIQLENGQKLRVDRVISTLSTFALASLLVSSPFLAAKLRELSYASVSVINIGFHQPVLPLRGFGYLIPSKIGLPVLGCVWDSCVFPQQNLQNQTRLTVMMGGTHHPEVEQMSEGELIGHSLQVLHEHLGIKADPHVVQVKKGKNAIPQFEVGYLAWQEEVKKAMDSRLILSGSGWTGVSINDCIAQARFLAEQMSIGMGSQELLTSPS